MIQGNALSLPNGWEIKKMGEVYDVRDGTHDSPKYVKEGYALITSKNLKNDNLNYNNVNYITEQDYININKRTKVDVGDILFAMIGTIGNPIVIKEEPDFAIKNVALFKVPSNQVSYYLKYYLDSGQVIEKMTKDAKGATQKFVGLGYLRNFEIPLPPIPEQQRIVAILDKAFEAIDKAKANAEQNLNNAKELFESYLQSVFFNGKLKIDNGEWEEITLGEVLEKTETVDPTKKPNEEFIYLDVSSVNKETKEIENATVLQGKNAPSRARKLVRTNDVIFATVRPTHSRVALITEKYDKQVCSTGYFVLRAKEFLSNNLVYYYLLTYSFNKQMEKLQKGASYPAVTDSEVKGIYIPFPKSLKAQQIIVAKLDA
ncbi:MAG: restriction endonuclease subunit S, partial [bacterium]